MRVVYPSYIIPRTAVSMNYADGGHRRLANDFGP